MARIRTIKPEFPHSESMGRVSRDARLLFIQLWTLCDDSGRARGNSRMLASLLFPYDDDAPGAIDNWLEELDREGCIVRYQIDSASYVQVCNWLNHQKIDKPSASKIPEFDESSRILANPRERSSLDQGVDQGVDQGNTFVSSKLPTCPHQEILSLFADVLPELPQPRIWEGTREKNLASRWKWVMDDLKKKGKEQTKEAGLDFFRRMFGYIKESDFMMGRNASWSADLGWIVKGENFSKIIDGNYENKVAA